MVNRTQFLYILFASVIALAGGIAAYKIVSKWDSNSQEESQSLNVVGHLVNKNRDVKRKQDKQKEQKQAKKMS